MNNLNDLVNRYTVRHDALIGKICAPLKNTLCIPFFVYYTIDTEGNFGILSNYPEQLEYFYDEKLYLEQPYLRHPQFFRSGFAITPATTVPHQQEYCARRYRVKDMFINLQKKPDGIEGFIFATQHSIEIDYLSHIDLLKCFGSYFKREARGLIMAMKREKYSLKLAKGDAFFGEDETLPLSHTNAKALQFMKQISPLSAREQQCLELYQQGYTSQATAALLELSPRTVEDYFENIKMKLGCASKLELLDL